jgi:hypothetical protein
MKQKRQYTGNSDGVAKGRRAGTTVWIQEVIDLSGGSLKSIGDFVVRDMRSKAQLSVHATGRAVDLSYRGVKGGRKKVVDVMRLLVKYSDEIGLEAILDYFPKPHGRGYRCDRGGWSRYRVPTIAGSPGGDWIHCEVSPEFADNPKKVRAGFAKIRAELLQGQSPAAPTV